MTLKSIIITCFATFILMVACSTDKIETFNGGDQVYFERVSSTADSLTLSFAVLDKDIQNYTVEIPIVVTGAICNHQRKVNISVIPEGTTAMEGVDYTLEETMIPAGSYNTTLKVNVKRSAELSKEEKTIMFQILPSDELFTDVNPAWTDFKLKINDTLTKPARWIYDCQPYFGVYSDVKYRFIIDTLGIWDFPSTGDNAIPKAQMLYYQDKMKTALAEYEKDNGPMYDENGNQVSF